MRALISISLLLAISACGSEATSRCNETCDREARCVDETAEQADRAAGAPSAGRPTFDSGECASACKALERDPEGKLLVDKHVECVAKAASCKDVLACP